MRQTRRMRPTKIAKPGKVASNATASPLSVRSSIKDIMARISLAPKRSPIAVFRRDSTGKGSNLVAVFGDTINTKRQAKTDKYFIGFFNNTMNDSIVEKKLIAANK